jgi:uncharacterized protein YndB with AHSA1/START domain
MTISFERSHDILIDAPPQAVFDYVTNPQSWPEWISATHHIDSANRPLTLGETFHETWHIRSGDVPMDWTVTTCDSPRLWIVRADTAFMGPIIIQYTCETVDGRTRFTRTTQNPERPKSPTDDQIARMDAEATTALGNIKTNVERRVRG